MGIVQFSFFDPTDIFNKIFKLDTLEPFNETFDKYGYSSLYAVQNLGTLTTFIVLLPVLWATSWFVYIILRGWKDYKAPWHKKIDRFVFFNGTFVFVDESYLLLAMSAVLNSYYLRWDTYGNIINSLFCFLLWGVVIASPFFFFGFFGSELRLSKLILRDSVFIERYGELVEPL